MMLCAVDDEAGARAGGEAAQEQQPDQQRKQRLHAVFLSGGELCGGAGGGL
jgi:hypothetical protein